MHTKRARTITFFLTLTFITLSGALGLAVNPWPRDGWYQTLYYLVGRFPGQENYVPIAAPALFYWMAHHAARMASAGQAGEFYLASFLQNLLVLLGAVCLYHALKALRLAQFAAPLTAGYLLAVLSTGLPQAFWSENVVLALMSVLILALARLYNDPISSPRVFWSLCILSGASIALLVTTRVVPVLLIPGLLLLFLGRLPASNIVRLVVIAILLTSIAIGTTVLANHARFGRYELTNSSGRHLWQGMREFSDSSLANEPMYQAMKRLDQNLQGKDWWDMPELPVPGKRPFQPNLQLAMQAPQVEQEAEDSRENVLGPLAKRAIATQPGTYLVQGWSKFLNTIGVAPHRLGFLEKGGWDPLHRNELLPSIATQLQAPPRFSAFIEILFGKIYNVFAALYPVAIVVIVVSYVAVMLRSLESRVSIERARRPALWRGMMAIAFFAFAAMAALFVGPNRGVSNKALLATSLCVIVVLASTFIFYRSGNDHERVMHTTQARLGLFSFLMFIFFGSLWFSWQIESSSPRNAIPYLPFWTLMLGLAADFWLRLSHSSEKHRGRHATTFRDVRRSTATLAREKGKVDHC